MRIAAGLGLVAVLALIGPRPLVGSPHQQAAQAVLVPPLIGLPLNRALQMLDSLRFSRGNLRRVSHPEPAGQVIDQTPRAESRVARGAKVDLVVSTGPAPSREDFGDQPAKVDSSTVPDLIGQNRLGAAVLLAIAKLSEGKIETVPDEAHDGKVVRQSPERGSRVPRNTPVDLWVGQAPPMSVPDLQDSTVSGAAEVLQAAGLRLGRVDSTLVAGGTRRIVRQRPGANAKAAKGSAVRVWYEYPPQQVPPPPPPPALSPKVRVPSVMDSSLAGAMTVLGRSGLAVGPVDSIELEQPPWLVRSQDPRGGDSVPPKTHVSLRVAVPSRLVRVPDLRDSTPVEARAALERVGLQLGGVTPVPRPGGNGRVISQAPLAEVTVLRGTVIGVRVSEPLQPDTTPPDVPVPNVERHSKAEAESLLRGAGLRVGRIEPVQAAGVGPDTVTFQAPEAGTVVAPGTPVDLQVTIASQGPVPNVAVPNLITRSRAEADSLLRSAGLRIGRIDSAPSGQAPVGTVLTQAPVAGTLVPPGALIDLQVAIPATGVAPADSGTNGGAGGPSITLILIVAGSMLGAGVLGVAGSQAWKQHRVDRKWKERVHWQVSALPGTQATDEGESLDGPEFTLDAHPGLGSQEVVGEGATIGESET